MDARSDGHHADLHYSAVAADGLHGPRRWSDLQQPNCLAPSHSFARVGAEICVMIQEPPAQDADPTGCMAPPFPHCEV